MESKFCDRLLRERPEFIGRTVWLFVNKLQKLECIVNVDGSVSVAGPSGLRFSTAKDIVKAIQSNSLTVNQDFKLPRKDVMSKDIRFSRNLYVSADRRNLVWSYINDPSLKLDLELELETSVGGRGGSSDTVCPGFLITGPLVDFVKSRSLKVGSGEMRSIYCSKRKRKKAAICDSCQQAKCIALASIRRLKDDKVVCEGFNERPLRETIGKLEWDGARAQFSSVIISPDKMKSKKCGLVKASYQKTCGNCRRAKETVKAAIRKFRRRQPNRERRLTFSGEKYLTQPEIAEKKKVLARKRKRLADENRKMAKRLKRMEQTLDAHKSNIPIVDRALVSVKQSLEKEHAKLVQPSCRWNANEHNCCARDRRFGLDDLRKHIFETHLIRQAIENRPVEPSKRQYSCSWEGCGRKQPFRKWKQFSNHVVSTHVGTRKQLEKFEASLCSMVNSNRAPSGRRYTAQAKKFYSSVYRSRASYKRTVRASFTPIPAVRTMIKYKNVEGVQAGVDHDLLMRMKRMAADRPNLRYGVLVFDEMAIRDGVCFNSAAPDTMIGLAHDKRGEKATQMLVFQFRPLFADPRLAFDVAWYGCAGLDRATLTSWFWLVVTALEFCDFAVLATICDGAGVNRSFQRCLLADQPKGVYSVPNVAKPDRRIFILSDPSHAIKKLRNSWCAKRRCLRKEDCLISWDHVKAVRNYQQRQKSMCIRVDRELTEKHLALTSFGKMTVQLALDVFSHPIENILRRLPVINSRGTRKFMEIARRMWSSMDECTVFHSYSDTERLRSELSLVAQYFDDWKAEIEAAVNAEVNGQRISATVRKRLSARHYLKFITHQCYDDISLIVKGTPQFLQYVFEELNVGEAGLCPKVLSQDRLEKDFSELRDLAGGGGNPTLYSAAYCLKTMNLHMLSEL